METLSTVTSTTSTCGTRMTVTNTNSISSANSEPTSRGAAPAVPRRPAPVAPVPEADPQPDLVQLQEPNQEEASNTSTSNTVPKIPEPEEFKDQIRQGFEIMKEIGGQIRLLNDYIDATRPGVNVNITNNNSDGRSSTTLRRGPAGPAGLRSLPAPKRQSADSTTPAPDQPASKPIDQPAEQQTEDKSTSTAEKDVVRGEPTKNKAQEADCPTLNTPSGGCEDTIHEPQKHRLNNAIWMEFAILPAKMKHEMRAPFLQPGEDLLDALTNKYSTKELEIIANIWIKELENRAKDLKKLEESITQLVTLNRPGGFPDPTITPLPVKWHEFIEEYIDRYDEYALKHALYFQRIYYLREKEVITMEKVFPTKARFWIFAGTQAQLYKEFQENYLNSLNSKIQAEIEILRRKAIFRARYPSEIDADSVYQNAEDDKSSHSGSAEHISESDALEVSEREPPKNGWLHPLFLNTEPLTEEQRLEIEDSICWTEDEDGDTVIKEEPYDETQISIAKEILLEGQKHRSKEGEVKTLAKAAAKSLAESEEVLDCPESHSLPQKRLGLLSRLKQQRQFKRDEVNNWKFWRGSMPPSKIEVAYKLGHDHM